MKPKELKQQEARERKRQWEGLTHEQRLNHLDRFGHRAVKQRIKLVHTILEVKWP
jgi:hypothetical protein